MAATGAPDAQGCNADNSNTWIASYDGTAEGKLEMLELTYAQAERATGVRIHETRRAPFVVRVDLVEESGAAHTVYEGIDKTACGDWLSVRFPLTTYGAKKVRVYTRHPEYEGIDAVGLEVPGGEAYAYNGFNQLLGVTPTDGSAATTFGYDGNGNQVSKTDSAGLTQYVYNPDNRLVGIALAGGGANAFEYDANGLRTKKTDSGGTTRYLLDGLSVIAQYAPDGARQAWYTQSLARIDEVLSVVNESGKLWYQADALGSVYGLTNTSGNLVGTQGYDVFGAPTPAPSGPAGQPFGFTGREHELDSGLVYARARYLNPAAGRWVRADPIGVRDGPNVYAYVHGAPTRYADPSGLNALALGPHAPVVFLAAFAMGAYIGGVTALMSGLPWDDWPFWQSVLLSGLTAGFSAIIPLKPLVAAIVGALVAAVNNVVTQWIAMKATNSPFSVGSLVISTLGGLLTGFLGGGIGAGSGIVDEELFAILMMGFGLSLPFEVLGAMVANVSAVKQAERAAAGTDEQNMCIDPLFTPWPGAPLSP